LLIKINLLILPYYHHYNWINNFKFLVRCGQPCCPATIATAAPTSTLCRRLRGVVVADVAMKTAVDSALVGVVTGGGAPPIPAALPAGAVVEVSSPGWAGPPPSGWTTTSPNGWTCVSGGGRGPSPPSSGVEEVEGTVIEAEVGLKIKKNIINLN
jgi:hypothetical protein